MTNVTAMLRTVDRVFDEMLMRLGCHDSNDAALISHWQTDPSGFRVQVTRKSDGKILTKFVNTEGETRP